MEKHKNSEQTIEQDSLGAAEQYFVSGQARPHLRKSKWLVPAFAACLGAAPLAQSWGRNGVSEPASVSAPAPAPAPANPPAGKEGNKEGGIAWLSGGIGDEGRDAMHAAATDYNVHVLFSSRQGNYLADIPFRVLTAAGKEVVSGTSEGPLLYLRLPDGNYKVSAKVDDAWQTRSARVVAKGYPVSLIFLGRGEGQ